MAAPVQAHNVPRFCRAPNHQRFALTDPLCDSEKYFPKEGRPRGEPVRDYPACSQLGTRSGFSLSASDRLMRWKMIKLKSTTKISTTTTSMAVTQRLEGRNCSLPQSKNAIPTSSSFRFSRSDFREQN